MRALILLGLVCLAANVKTKDVATRPLAADDSDVQERLSGVLRSLEQQLDDIGTNDVNEGPSLREINQDTIGEEVQTNRTLENVETQLERIRNKIIKEMLKKLALKVFEETILKVEIKLLKLTSRVLAKIAAKTGIKLLARLGLKAGQKVAVKAATLLATKLGTTVSTAASTGPAAPIVAAVMLAFDVLSIGLDLFDAGGYLKMGTKEEYYEMKVGVDKELKKELGAEGGEFPGVVGPLDKLSDVEYEALVNTTINEIMNANNSNPILDNVLTKLDSDISSQQLTEADIEDDAKLELYAQLVESDEVFDLICKNLEGKAVVTGTGDRQCSYKDKATCDSSYSWPMAEDSNEIYGEYKTNVFGGACVTASYAFRSICENNDLPYDPDTGICQIDETYCKTKGADWGYNEDIKEFDCVINPGQSFAEMLFGTTIVRGLKQIFDPDQYEKCKEDEIDDGYFCRSIFCAEGHEQWADAGLCYPKCDAGYHPFGCCICSPDCPEGWTDDGATCRRAGYCEPDKEHDGALCYDMCEDGYNGVGPVCWAPCPEGYTDVGLLCSKGGQVHAKSSRPADKTACPSGMRDDGTSCWKDTYGRGAGRIPDKGACPSGLRDDGTSCWSDAHIYGKGCCCTLWGCCGNCNSGYNDDGCTCRKTDVGIKLTLFDRQTCRYNEDMCLALCYPKCEYGYHPVGCNLCEPDGGPGIKVTVFERYYCNSDEKEVAGVCWSICPAGQTDDGAFCRVPLHTIPQESYGRGVGTPDTVIEGKAASYGRGVGTPAVHIRAKARIIPFSTKSNK